MKCLLVAAFLGLASISPPWAQAAEKTPPAFVDAPAVREFIAEMRDRHGFDAERLARQFAAIRANPRVLQAIRPAPEQQRSWQRYRARFLNERRLAHGLLFRREHGAALARAEAIYNVPPEIIVAIIGVETEYGRNMGRFNVFEALATLAFDYPPRAEYFRRELEQFLLMARENDTPPLAYKGSYAGAIGIPQFMPNSQRHHAVDFDGDGRADLIGSFADAIGSVAHFLHVHGWRPGQPVALPASVAGDAGALVALGIKPSLSLREMTDRGVLPLADTVRLADEPVALIDLPSPGQPTEYWLGFDNFHVITRYNRSSFYAMSVFLLAEALREAWERER
ncbi:MAG: lytic murein transglycosylase B [Candidatus Accumulibacter sp.]|nr:lytic murein transglycosylase B [Accumulibacter sp.]